MTDKNRCHICKLHGKYFRTSRLNWRTVKIKHFVTRWRYCLVSLICALFDSKSMRIPNIKAAYYYTYIFSIFSLHFAMRLAYQTPCNECMKYCISCR